MSDLLAQVWQEGWDVGNEYAISEPFDNRAARNQNPYASTDGLFSEVFRFDWEKAPLSLNYNSMHRMAKSKIVKEIRSLMHAKARHIPDLGKCRVELVWFVNTHHTRDEENIVPVLKALCDGLVDAEVVPDDIPRYMKKMMPEIRYVPKKTDVAHFEFTVHEVAA